MLYQITVQVDADAMYREPYRIEVDGFLIEILLKPEVVVLQPGDTTFDHTSLIPPEPQRLVAALNISKKVEGYRDFLPEFSAATDGRPLQISLRDTLLLSELTALAQHLEAIGSFWLGIKKVYWEQPRRSWVPETPEEEEDLKSLPNHFQTKTDENKGYVVMNPDMLKSIIAERSLHRDLVLPMSFFREGCNDFAEGRYTPAFLSFYFYLDDLYGQGKTKNQAVKAKLKSSQQVRLALEQSIQDFNEEVSAPNLLELRKFLVQEGKEYTVDGLIDLVVQVRGNLAHFSQKSSKKKGHPLNQRDFRVMAYLMKSICTYTFIELTTGVIPE